MSMMMRRESNQKLLFYELEQITRATLLYNSVF